MTNATVTQELNTAQGRPALSFATAAQISLHVETIALLLFTATVAPAAGPCVTVTWDQVSPTTRDVFRQHAQIAVLRLNGVVNAVALAHVRMFHNGAAGEAAIETYDRELLRHAPMTGGL
jgi:hypothetical protein